MNIFEGRAAAEKTIFEQDWHPLDHISFASNHDDKEVFEIKEIDYDGVTHNQVMWPNHCVVSTFVLLRLSLKY